MSQKPSNLHIDGQRFWDSLMEMAKIGATPKGGCNRQTLTDLDKQGRELFRSWVEAIGCTVEVDEMGNMFARRPGKRDDLPPVVIGSHLDTQPTGGKFDGVAGVLCGLEVLRTLHDAGYETDHPVMVVNWTNEEGARFSPAMVSSGVWAGVLDRDWAYGLKDRDGKTFGEELARIGFKGDKPCQAADWKCHFELHIEQGPILEAEDKQIGVVTGVQGIRWLDVTITGKESHAGSTPMPRRQDALVAASKVIIALDEIARRYPPAAVATVGEIKIAKPSRNVIPGEVWFTVDLRHPETATVDAMERDLRAAVEAACARDELPFQVERLWDSPPVEFHPDCIEAVENAAQEAGYRHRRIVSGPGHDSAYTARKVPTSMIFIPCKDGLSHNEEESAKPEDLAAGCEVMLRAVLTMAQAA
ncbi:M20 family metallo-hydrolase [Geminicoccus harenae]|uniref:M20 family metallo-hydrolase n=1 Tax=Geminicoccus harenae TaxID=2498453 RepID=UPI00168B895D|nr:M20 family metallo-hydrolase [Geminicoccus harenae]